MTPLYHVLFRAAWTGWKWIRWNGVFGTQKAAYDEINKRRAYADSVERVVCVREGRVFFEVSKCIPIEVGRCIPTEAQP